MPRIRIISGGQTGVDQGALDFAIMVNFSWGGWAPRGWITEAGPLPDRYRWDEETQNGLEENEKGPGVSYKAYKHRTKRNVVETDGTLVLYNTALFGGSLLTQGLCRLAEKPILVLDLKRPGTWDGGVQFVLDFIEKEEIKELNVAGPRQSKQPGIQVITKEFLCKVFGV